MEGCEKREELKLILSLEGKYYHARGGHALGWPCSIWAVSGADASLHHRANYAFYYPSNVSGETILNYSSVVRSEVRLRYVYIGLSVLCSVTGSPRAQVPH
jgi:hypothetical protein